MCRSCSAHLQTAWGGGGRALLKVHLQMDEEGAGRNLCLTRGVGDQGLRAT